MSARYWFGDPDYPKDRFAWWEPVVDWIERTLARRRAEREIAARERDRAG